MLSADSIRLYSFGHTVTVGSEVSERAQNDTNVQQKPSRDTYMACHAIVVRNIDR